jgi:hypothetical protein
MMPDGRSVDVLVPPGFKPGDVIGVLATEGLPSGAEARQSKEQHPLG